MTSVDTKVKLLDRPAVRIATTAALVLFILFARRYAQMLDPQVWNEEGIIISQLAANGLVSIFTPLNGYFVLLPRLLTLIGLLVPLAEYPRFVTILTWLATLAILLAISFVPSRLRGGPLLAVSVLLVPSDAEVFGVPLYSFVWSIPLIYACYFWRLNGRAARWRIATIVLCGLSSAAIFVVTPLFVVRAIRTRARADVLAAIAAASCALVQVAALLNRGSLGAPGSTDYHATVAQALPVVEKFGGGYLVWNFLSTTSPRPEVALVFGALSLIFFIAVSNFEPELRRRLVVLLYLWAASAAMSAVRIDTNIIDQVTGAPRYYFLPFLVEGWILLQIALGAARRPLRAIAGVMLVCACFNAMPALSRTHADLDWKDAVKRCATLPAARIGEIPIQGDGTLQNAQILFLRGSACRRLSRFGLIGFLLPRA